jgi:hypothetical protein
MSNTKLIDKVWGEIRDHLLDKDRKKIARKLFDLFREEKYFSTKEFSLVEFDKWMETSKVSEDGKLRSYI